VTVPFWTANGTIDLAELRPEDMTVEIIGGTLAKANRFGGRTPEPWSVAVHSVLVEHLCPPDVRPWALLHDAHEAFLGDLMTPSVDLIALCCPKPAVIEQAIHQAKGRIDRAIGSAWGVPVRSMNAAVRQADHVAVIAEAAMFLGVRPERASPAEEEMLDRAISLLRELPVGGDWRAARDLWIARIDHYASLGRMSPPRATRTAGVVPAA
jgi:hypothetical protein